MENTTKIITAWELFSKGSNKSSISRHLCKDRETIRIWIRGIEELGLNEYLERYVNAKKGNRERRIDPILKRRIWEIRESEAQCCGQKIQWYLKKRYDSCVSIPTIYRILKEKYKIRSKWKKNQKRGNVPKAFKPREVIQMDTVDFGDIYAFTGVDIYTREVDVLLTPQLTSKYGYRFLARSMVRRFDGHSDMIQTDGGSEFKDYFKKNVLEYCKRHRIARPYKKNEQSYIESFNRTLRKECLGWKKYRKQEIVRCVQRVEKFLYRYHYERPHIGLGMKVPLVK
jgi:transposase InsO family protein